jgi:D-serine deaminase-like pyridoxal phosphate-dependent protein
MDETTMIDRTGNNASVATLAELETPCLILDADRMDRNIVRLRERLDGFNVSLRPHLKTSKSVEVARRVMNSPAELHYGFLVEIDAIAILAGSEQRGPPPA